MIASSDLPAPTTHTGTFRAKLDAASTAHRSLLCVGLDPEPECLPASLRGLPPARAAEAFCREIVLATHDLVCAYKPNLAFFLALGRGGLDALRAVREAVPADIPLLLDAKFGDIGNTAEAYARFAFEDIGADAVTVNPYLGGDASAPFLARPDRTAFLLVKTSNPGSGDVQDVPTATGETVAMHVARQVATWGAAHGNAGVVVGATYPAALAAVRATLPDAPILVPGVGVQGGDFVAAVTAGVDARGGGLLLSASRSVLYASSGADYATAARTEAMRLREAMGTVGNRQ